MTLGEASESLGFNLLIKAWNLLLCVYFSCMHVFSFEQGLMQVTQANFKFTVQLKRILNFWSSYLHLLSAGITDVDPQHGLWDVGYQMQGFAHSRKTFKQLNYTPSTPTLLLLLTFCLVYSHIAETSEATNHLREAAPLIWERKNLGVPSREPYTWLRAWRFKVHCVGISCMCMKMFWSTPTPNPSKHRFLKIRLHICKSLISLTPSPEFLNLNLRLKTSALLIDMW